MSRLRLLGTASLLCLAATAHASSFLVTTDAVVGALQATTDTTRSCAPPATTPPASSPAMAGSAA